MNDAAKLLMVVAGLELVSSLMSGAEARANQDFVSEKEAGENLLALREVRWSASVAERVVGAVELYEDGTFEGDMAAEARAWLSGEDEVWVRYYLLSAFVGRDEDEDTALILGYLDDAEPTLRRAAARYATDHLSPDLEARLAARYQKEGFWWMKTAILEALGGGETDVSLDLLHEALQDPVRDVRAAAVEALRERRDPRSIKPLVRALQWDDMVGVDSPLGVLGEIDGAAAGPRLERAATSPYPVIRRMAAFGLKGAGSSNSAPILLGLLTDPDETVQWAAAGALVELGVTQAVEDVLIFLTSHRDEWLLSDLAWMKGIDTVGSCRDLEARGELTDEMLQTLSGMCDRIEQHLREGTSTISTSSVAALGEGSEFDSCARLVDPAGRERALGWARAPGERNGGSLFRLQRGTVVSIEEGAYSDGETWLLVTGDSLEQALWVKEIDLLPIRPAELLKQPLRDESDR